jgi:hypothetical protein
MQEFPTIPYSYGRKNQEPLFTPPMVENTKTNFHPTPPLVSLTVPICLVVLLGKPSVQALHLSTFQV